MHPTTKERSFTKPRGLVPIFASRLWSLGRPGASPLIFFSVRLWSGAESENRLYWPPRNSPKGASAWNYPCTPPPIPSVPVTCSWTAVAILMLCILVLAMGDALRTHTHQVRKLAETRSTMNEKFTGK